MADGATRRVTFSLFSSLLSSFFWGKNIDVLCALFYLHIIIAVVEHVVSMK